MLRSFSIKKIGVEQDAKQSSASNESEVKPSEDKIDTQASAGAPMSVSPNKQTSLESDREKFFGNKDVRNQNFASSTSIGVKAGTSVSEEEARREAEIKSKHEARVLAEQELQRAKQEKLRLAAEEEARRREAEAERAREAARAKAKKHEEERARLAAATTATGGSTGTGGVGDAKESISTSRKNLSENFRLESSDSGKSDGLTSTYRRFDTARESLAPKEPNTNTPSSNATSTANSVLSKTGTSTTFSDRYNKPQNASALGSNYTSNVSIDSFNSSNVSATVRDDPTSTITSATPIQVDPKTTFKFDAKSNARVELDARASRFEEERARYAADAEARRKRDMERFQKDSTRSTEESSSVSNSVSSRVTVQEPSTIRHRAIGDNMKSLSQAEEDKKFEELKEQRMAAAAARAAKLEEEMKNSDASAMRFRGRK